MTIALQTGFSGRKSGIWQGVVAMQHTIAYFVGKSPKCSANGRRQLMAIKWRQLFLGYSSHAEIGAAPDGFAT
jgi:hypothetical protein